MKIFDPKLKLIVYANDVAHTIVGSSDIALHVTFDVLLTRSDETNAATIQVYNLSATSRHIFSDAHQAIELHAGYDNELGLIFRGYTKNITHERNGLMWITTIYAADGDKEIATTYFSKTFAKGTSNKQIIAEIANSFGIDTIIDDPLFEKKILTSQTYHGTSRNMLTRACKDWGYRWSIQHGVLEVLDEGSAIQVTPQAIVISADTGMLGSPIIRDRTEALLREDSTAIKGKEKLIQSISVITSLDPAIKPNRLVKLKASQTINQTSEVDTQKQKSVDYNRVYIVDRAHFYGDNFGGDFVVEVEADIYDEDRKKKKTVREQTEVTHQI